MFLYFVFKGGNCCRDYKCKATRRDATYAKTDREICGTIL